MNEIDQLKADIRRLEDENADLKAEIQACHAVLDGAGLAMPEDIQKHDTNSQERLYGLVARITQAVVRWSCPMMLRRK